MEISRRTDYAIRLISALALNGDSPLSVREAAEKNDVPYAFARSIQHDLVQSGIVKAVRGSQGGMLLAIDPSDLTLCRLIEIMQGPINVATCTSDPDWCKRQKGCPFHPVWLNLEVMIRNYLCSINIKQLMVGEEIRLPSKLSFFCQ
ncbi:MAG: Rrf2 family transcriptional regulator [Coriobacteriales bacterium]|nr:Rrf2 family transcriptional regulator [Coriobacteriales bacterium]